MRSISSKSSKIDCVTKWFNHWTLYALHWSTWHFKCPFPLNFSLERIMNICEYNWIRSEIVMPIWLASIQQNGNPSEKLSQHFTWVYDKTKAAFTTNGIEWIAFLLVHIDIFVCAAGGWEGPAYGFYWIDVNMCSICCLHMQNQINVYFVCIYMYFCASWRAVRLQYIGICVCVRWNIYQKQMTCLGMPMSSFGERKGSLHEPTKIWWVREQRTTTSLCFFFVTIYIIGRCWQ